MTNKFVKGLVGKVRRMTSRLNTIAKMTRSIVARIAPVLALAATTVAVLSGCGGGTQTVSTASSPTGERASATKTSGAGSTSSAPAAAQQAGRSESSGATGGAPAQTTTRSAPEPAFAEKEKSSDGGERLATAEATVRRQGYKIDDPSDYHANQTLTVLIGTGERSNDGYDKRAFFFVDGKYIGTDSTQPSAGLSVSGQSDTEVVLSYTLYKPGNSLCCPAGGQAKVRFQLNDGRLAPLDPIPPVSSNEGTSRQ